MSFQVGRHRLGGGCPGLGLSSTLAVSGKTVASPSTCVQWGDTCPLRLWQASIEVTRTSVSPAVKWERGLGLRDRVQIPATPGPQPQGRTQSLSLVPGSSLVTWSCSEACVCAHVWGCVDACGRCMDVCVMSVVCMCTCGV